MAMPTPPPNPSAESSHPPSASAPATNHAPVTHRVRRVMP